MALAQDRVDARHDPERRRDRRGRVLAASEVGGDERGPCEVDTDDLGGALGLDVTRISQTTALVTLDALLDVPDRLAVAHEQQPTHAHAASSTAPVRASRCGTSAHSRSSA